MMHETLWRAAALAVGTLGFVVGNAYAEIKRRLNPETQPISAYITGPYGIYESAGFLSLAVGFFCLSGPVWWTLLSIATGVALLFIVLTKWLMKYGLYSWLLCSDSSQVETIHLVSAGIAFSLLVGIEAWALWPSPLVALPFAAPVSALIFTLFARSQTAIEEKVYTVLLLGGMIEMLILWL